MGESAVGDNGFGDIGDIADIAEGEIGDIGDMACAVHGMMDFVRRGTTQTPQAVWHGFHFSLRCICPQTFSRTSASLKTPVCLAHLLHWEWWHQQQHGTPR